MTWEPRKARERFNLAHAPLGTAQTKLQAFLEKQLNTPGQIRCYGTTSNLSQQLKNKLSQAITIPNGMLTLSLESRAVHDRAITTLVDDWGKNIGWPKAVACVAVIHPADAGWKIATIVEWSSSTFPQLVKHMFPDVTILQAKGSPSAGGYPLDALTGAVLRAKDSLALSHEFEVDGRNDEPTDPAYRESEFRKGWRAALGPDQKYKSEGLRKLGWNNLGYRLGRLFGDTSDDMIGVIFDWIVRQQK